MRRSAQRAESYRRRTKGPSPITTLITKTADDVRHEGGPRLFEPRPNGGGAADTDDLVIGIEDFDC